jgi:GNAT superfamily N-acetyltransferase
MGEQPAPTRMSTIRRVRPGDEGRVSDLSAQLGYPSTPDAIRDRLEAMRDPDAYMVYVAEDPTGRLVGWVGLYVFRTVEAEPCAEISGFVVDEAVRSRGIGGALLAAAEVWARARGSATLAVRSNVVRTRAHAFYGRHGFVPVKTQAALSKRL